MALQGGGFVQLGRGGSSACKKYQDGPKTVRGMLGSLGQWASLNRAYRPSLTGLRLGEKGRKVMVRAGHRGPRRCGQGSSRCQKGPQAVGAMRAAFSSFDGPFEATHGRTRVSFL